MYVRRGVSKNFPVIPPRPFFLGIALTISVIPCRLGHPTCILKPTLFKVPNFHTFIVYSVKVASQVQNGYDKHLNFIEIYNLKAYGLWPNMTKLVIEFESLLLKRFSLT